MEQEVSEGIPHLVHLCMERDVLYEYMFGLVCCGWYTGAVVLQRVAACCSMLQHADELCFMVEKIEPDDNICRPVFGYI